MLALIRGGLLPTPVAQLGFLAALTAAGAAVAWWALYPPALEQACEVLLLPLYRVRAFGPGRDKIPTTGPLLVVANHQSYFDPPIIGASIRGRQLDYLARSATFHFKPLAALITVLNAIPLKEDTSDDE